MVLQIVVIFFLLVIFVLPVFLLAWFYFSKYRSCPFCGEKMLKGETVCPSCNSEMPESENYDKKALNVARAYQDGHKQFLDDGRKPKD